MSTYTVGPKMSFPGSKIPPNTRLLNNNTWVISENQEYLLISQSDGNVVLYQVLGQPPQADGDTFSGKATWAAGTDGQGSAYFIVQNDGNLVIYNRSNDPIWASKTDGNTPLFLVVQDDGNLVLYKQAPLWASGTAD